MTFVRNECKRKRGPESFRNTNCTDGGPYSDVLEQTGPRTCPLILFSLARAHRSTRLYMSISLHALDVIILFGIYCFHRHVVLARRSNGVLRNFDSSPTNAESTILSSCNRHYVHSVIVLTIRGKGSAVVLCADMIALKTITLVNKSVLSVIMKSLMRHRFSHFGRNAIRRRSKTSNIY